MEKEQNKTNEVNRSTSIPKALWTIQFKTKWTIYIKYLKQAGWFPAPAPRQGVVTLLITYNSTLTIIVGHMSVYSFFAHPKNESKNVPCSRNFCFAKPLSKLRALLYLLQGWISKLLFAILTTSKLQFKFSPANNQHFYFSFIGKSSYVIFRCFILKFLAVAAAASKEHLG